MREKRVNLVVLTCSVLVATCASVSYSFVTSDSLDSYVKVISAIPILLSGQINSASAATVWIPSDEAENTEGSVNDEFQEVAHVFARPGVRVVKGKEEDDTMQQAIPWTSLKDEWKIYEKIQQSRRKTAADKLKKKNGVKEPAKVQADDEGSSEEDDGEDEEEEDDGEHPPPPPPPPQADEDGDDDGSSEEDDEPDARTSVSLPDIIAKASGSFPPDDEKPILVKKAKPKSDSLPLAFFGQQNHDDDEKDFLKDEATVFKRKKPIKKKVISKESEEDDVSSSNEQAASVEDYADYAVDDDDDAEEGDDEGNKKNKKKDLSFNEIPLAIREMILNDLANQNNGTGYVPNLTPKVTGGSSASTENDNASGENSSEEDDNNAAEVPQRDINDPDPTPPAVSKPKKGDSGDEDEAQADGGGKKGKGKKKKGKKKKGGWGWKKPQGWGHVHIPAGWGHKHEKGWGWDDKHDGVLEQLVKGSTWERVLKYYHWKRDEAHQDHGEGHHDHHDHHHGGGFGHHDHHEDHGWGWKGEGSGIKKIVKKAFKGSFWERAVHTYAQYKENQAKNPKKPALIDLDSDHLNLGR